MRTVEEIEAGIAELERIRAQKDGVHMIHTYLSILGLCRDLRLDGDTSAPIDVAFEETMTNARIIARTGFPPKSRLDAKIVRARHCDVGD